MTVILRRGLPCFNVLLSWRSGFADGLHACQGILQELCCASLTALVDILERGQRMKMIAPTAVLKVMKMRPRIVRMTHMICLALLPLPPPIVLLMEPMKPCPYVTLLLHPHLMRMDLVVLQRSALISVSSAKVLRTTVRRKMR